MKIDVFRKLIGYRSSQRRCFVKKGILKNPQENTCVGVSFLTTSLKERPWHRCFPMNFAKFLKTPFFIEHLKWLLRIYYCSFHRKFLFLFHSHYRFSNSFCLFIYIKQRYYIVSNIWSSVRGEIASHNLIVLFS